MADLASALAGSLVEKLGSLVYRELYLAWGVQSNLQKLERTISTIKIVLLDAEYKQASNPNLRIWLGQLKDILYNAEDVVDEIEYKALRKQAITKYGSTSTKMDRCLTNLRTLMFMECASLTSLIPIIKHLTALEILYISDCEEMDLKEGGGDALDLNLRLQIFHIINLPKLEILPEWLLGSANTLKELRIKKCENLKALPEWLPTLKSLQTLEITECNELSSLPVGIHHMKTLRKVKIKDCPELVTRLEDWSNILELELDSKNAEDDEDSEKREDDEDDQEDDEDSKKGEDDEEDA